MCVATEMEDGAGSDEVRDEKLPASCFFKFSLSALSSFLSHYVRRSYNFANLLAVFMIVVDIETVAPSKHFISRSI